MNSRTITQIAVANGVGKKFAAETHLILAADGLFDRVQLELAKINGDGRLNQAAKAADTRALADKSAKLLAPMQRELMKLYGEHDAAIAALVPKFGDVSEAMKLALADRLSRMSGAEHAALFQNDNVDQRLLAAIFELPPMLTTVASGLVDSMRQRTIEATNGPELAELAERKEAIELAQAGLQITTNLVIELAGHKDSAPAAEAWIKPHLDAAA